MAVLYAMLSGISPQGSSFEGKYNVMNLILELLHPKAHKTGQFDFVPGQKPRQYIQCSKHTNTAMNAPFQEYTGAFKRGHEGLRSV